MALPVHPNAISLLNIQTEFGGAVPISMSEYRGGYVTNGTKGYPLGVETTIPSSGAISFGNFHGASAAPAAYVNNPITGLVNISVVDDEPVGDIALAGVGLLGNGTYQVDNNSAPQITGNWYTPTTVGIGSSYWVKYTVTGTTVAQTGDSYATATTDWISISTDPGFSCIAGFSGGGGRAAYTYKIEIASDSGGANIVSTTTGIYLDAHTS